MSFTEQVRQQVRAATGTCPTCGQPTKPGGQRGIADEMGIPHTVLWRFLRGGDITGRNLDHILVWLDRAEYPFAPSAEPPETETTP